MLIDEISCFLPLTTMLWYMYLLGSSALSHVAMALPVEIIQPGGFLPGAREGC